MEAVALPQAKAEGTANENDMLCKPCGLTKATCSAVTVLLHSDTLHAIEGTPASLAGEAHRPERHLIIYNKFEFTNLQVMASLKTQCTHVKFLYKSKPSKIKEIGSMPIRSTLEINATSLIIHRIFA